jgi:hypothetical protein
MNRSDAVTGDRNVTINGDTKNSVIITGDKNIVHQPGKKKADVNPSSPHF